VPVNDSVVIGFELPAMTPEENKKKFQLFSDLLAVAANQTAAKDDPAAALAKRAYHTWCGKPGGSASVWIHQLQKGGENYCSWAISGGFPAGTGKGGWWNQYLAPDSSWQPFRNRYHSNWWVWFGGSLRPGYTWTYANCLYAM
jgi:hypothetical protein